MRKQKSGFYANKEYSAYGLSNGDVRGGGGLENGEHKTDDNRRL